MREKKKKNFSFEWIQTLQHGGLVKRIPKEKTCPQEKRRLLILVLSEIRRVSFYQRGMENQ